MDPNYDPAFGPVSGLSSTVQMPEREPVYERMQTLLNQLGFGPIKVSGLWDADTIAAVKRFLASQNVRWNAEGGEPLQRADVMERLEKAASVVAADGNTGLNTTQAAASAASAAPVPFWKRKNFLLGAAAVAAVAGYVAYRTGKLDGVLGELGMGSDAEADGDLGSTHTKPKRTRRKLAAPKCDRLPDVDFSELEDVAEVVEES